MFLHGTQWDGNKKAGGSSQKSTVMERAPKTRVKNGKTRTHTPEKSQTQKKRGGKEEGKGGGAANVTPVRARLNEVKGGGGKKDGVKTHKKEAINSSTQWMERPSSEKKDTRVWGEKRKGKQRGEKKEGGLKKKTRTVCGKTSRQVKKKPKNITGGLNFLTVWGTTEIKSRWRKKKKDLTTKGRELAKD